MLDLTLRKIAAFHDALLLDPRYVALKASEEAMMKDESAQRLSQEKDRLNEIYNENCRLFGEDNEKTKESYHALYETKCALEALPSVAAYQAAYSDLHFVILEIDDILIGPFRSKRRCAK